MANWRNVRLTELKISLDLSTKVASFPFIFNKIDDLFTLNHRNLRFFCTLCTYKMFQNYWYKFLTLCEHLENIFQDVSVHQCWIQRVTWGIFLNLEPHKFKHMENNRKKVSKIKIKYLFSQFFIPNLQWTESYILSNYILTIFYYNAVKFAIKKSFLYIECF